MRKNFSLYKNLEKNLETIEQINDCLKITLGPTGKNGIVANKKNDLKVLTRGSLLINSLDFPSPDANIILKLFEQAAIKTNKISGDGSTTTILIICQLLKSSLSLLVNGYNSVFLSQGLKKIAYFLIEKILEFARPITELNQMKGVVNTSIGNKISPNLLSVINKSIEQIGRDGLIVVEENILPDNEIEIVQGIELDRGYASSYFVNDMKNFEVVYENPVLLIANVPINSINQIRDIVEYIKKNNRPLIIVAEEINKDVVSTLVLNNIQKKIKVAVIKYSSVKFIKNGILDDLAVLTHSNYFVSNLKNTTRNFSIDDLGQSEKVIIKKDKSTFIVSKFSKVIAKRRINELNRELLTSETEYEKSLVRTRIARLSGNIAKIKIGVSNQYQIEEERQKVESVINTIQSSLEEGVVPGGGIGYIYLREELKNWGYVNLIGEELFSIQIVLDSLVVPIKELFMNTNTPRFKILENVLQLGFPYGYNLIDQKIVNTFEEGLIDSAKSVRSILWNSLTLVSTIIISE